MKLYKEKVKKADFTAATTLTLIADWKAILKAKICDRGNAFCTKIRIETIVLLAIHQLLCCLEYKPATISQVQNGFSISQVQNKTRKVGRLVWSRHLTSFSAQAATATTKISQWKTACFLVPIQMFIPLLMPAFFSFSRSHSHFLYLQQLRP